MACGKKRKTRVIIDCNVVISAGLTRGVCYKVIERAVREGVVILSDEILNEYREVSKRKYFAERFDELSELIDIISNIAIFVQPEHLEISLPDEDDLKYLEAGISGNADFLVTGNLKDFKNTEYGSVAVVSPRQFLEL
ncbi:MAG: putative toxin-antitoxin system toxin component, PIN family [Magnetococcales bacterium]|nr:putative toxin-antitoxin system toxin component, PIN family [Magnetococcales bacterium]